MSFIIQDLLDYAQIKAGKFRKNIESFDLMESVEKVISIQQQNAKAKGIGLCVVYENVKRKEKRKISCFDIIKNDEQQAYSSIIETD